MNLHHESLSARCLLLVVLLLLVGGLTSCTPTPPALVNPPLSTLRVVMDDNYPPYAFRDGEGNVQGILVDQWKLWEERTGVKVEINALPWSEALERMKAGEFDVVDTIFYTDERAQIFDFTPAYAQIAVPIFFHNNISGIADAGDLTGFRVAVKAGDANVDYLIGQGLSDLSFYNSYEEIAQAAARREEAIFVIDQPPALYFLYKYGIHDQFNHSAPLYSGEFHRAVRKGGTAVLNLVNAGFAAISSADYQAIDRRWLGTGETNQLLQIAPYIVAGVAIIALIVLALIWINRTLQQRVRQRTQELEETAEALHESRRFLADLIEYSGALIFVKDREGRYELINRKWEEVTGLTRDDVMGRTDEILFPGPIGQQFRANDLEVIDTGDALEREEFLEDASGRRSFISIKFPVRGEDGHLKGICGMTTEITERKRAESQREAALEALAESEEIFRLFMEHSPIYVFFKDEETRSLRLSKNYEQMLGRPLSELLGKTMDELFPSDLAKSMIADDQRILREGKQVEVVEELSGRIFRTIKFPIAKEGRPRWLAGYTIDITEQARAEMTLKENERLLNRSQTIARMGHWQWDTRANKVTWSDEMYRIFGFERESFTGNLDEIIDAAIHPDDKDRVLKSNEAVLTEQKPATLEYRVVWPDGSIRYVWAQPGDSIMDELGNIVLLSGVVQDITERKRAEEALRQSEGKFSKAFHTSPDSININRLRDGLYLEINEGFTAMTGYTADDVSGKTSLELNVWANPEDRARLVQGLQERGEVSNLEATFRKKDGRWLTGLMSARILDVAGEQCILTITRDITERKQAEEALRHSEERYQTFISQSFEGISRTEFDHPIDVTLPVETQIDLIYDNAYMAECNQALADMYHLPSPDTFVGARLIEAHGDKDNPVNRAAFRRLIENGYKSMGDETVEYRADGERVWFLSNTVGTVENGHLVRLWGTALDITERKQVEARIKQLNQELEQRVADRTRELAEANARLTELDQLKSKFVSDVSHELRTPIANLKLYIELLGRGKLEKQLQYIEVLHQQVRRVAALVDDILDLSRLERRKEQGLVYRAVALNDVVEQVVLAHQPRAESDGLHLTFEPGSPLPPVRADANQLAQVVTNLIANALSYTSAGYVRVSTTADKDVVCLSVADSGSGIAPEDLPHVFDRFYRGEHVLKNDVPGTGLGLAIVKEIVELHEGRIEVDSRPGQGTTFRVWLRVA